MVFAAPRCRACPAAQLDLGLHAVALRSDRSHSERRVTLEFKDATQLLSCLEVAYDKWIKAVSLNFEFVSVHLLSIWRALLFQINDCLIVNATHSIVAFCGMAKEEFDAGLRVIRIERS